MGFPKQQPPSRAGNQRVGNNVERFLDRQQAGRLLGRALRQFGKRNDVVVLGLPRGGVPVADEVARSLQVPLDVVVVRKIGMPARPEVALGALASVAGHIETVRNEEIMAALGAPGEAEAVFARVAAEERVELFRRQHLYLGQRARVVVRGKIVILVDDGLATGATMRAAVAAVRSHQPAWLVVAVPVGSHGGCSAIELLVDNLTCLRTPEPFRSVSQEYRHFAQTSDAEVLRILGASREPETPRHGPKGH